MIAEAGDRDCPGGEVHRRAGAAVRDQVRGGLLRIWILQVMPSGTFLNYSHFVFCSDQLLILLGVAGAPPGVSLSASPVLHFCSQNPDLLCH